MRKVFEAFVYLLFTSVYVLLLLLDLLFCGAPVNRWKDV